MPKQWFNLFVRHFNCTYSEPSYMVLASFSIMNSIIREDLEELKYRFQCVCRALLQTVSPEWKKDWNQTVKDINVIEFLSAYEESFKDTCLNNFKEAYEGIISTFLEEEFSIVDRKFSIESKELDTSKKALGIFIDHLIKCMPTSSKAGTYRSTVIFVLLLLSEKLEIYSTQQLFVKQMGFSIDHLPGDVEDANLHVALGLFLFSYLK